MTEINIDDARDRFEALVDEVERGGEVTITRHGKVVARLIQAADPERAEAVVQGLRALRAQIVARGESFSIDDINAARAEGRR